MGNNFYAARANTSCDALMLPNCPCPLGDFVAEAPRRAFRVCSAQIRRFDLAKFDCWIRTDHMSQDVGECFAKFEARGGYLKRDWDPNASSIAESNANAHPPCEDMYDPRFSDLVNRVDG